MPELYVSWSDYRRTVEQLAVAVYESGWTFDQIVCVAKGGLRVGDVLSRVFDRPLAVFSAASYGGAGNRERGQIVLSRSVAMTVPDLGPRVLLADDLVDSGVSLHETELWLRDRYPNIAELRTAVLWYKACSQVVPDYYVRYLANNPWIHQPFEPYEQLSPAELAARHSPSVALGD